LRIRVDDSRVRGSGVELLQKRAAVHIREIDAQKRGKRGSEVFEGQRSNVSTGHFL
jgi:hypothetical protein